jgi:hypothetical protein
MVVEERGGMPTSHIEENGDFSPLFSWKRHA